MRRIFCVIYQQFCSHDLLSGAECLGLWIEWSLRSSYWPDEFRLWAVSLPISYRLTELISSQPTASRFLMPLDRHNQAPLVNNLPESKAGLGCSMASHGRVHIGKSTRTGVTEVGGHSFLSPTLSSPALKGAGSSFPAEWTRETFFENSRVQVVLNPGLLAPVASTLTLQSQRYLTLHRPRFGLLAETRFMLAG